MSASTRHFVRHYGVVEDIGTLLLVEHVVMFPSILVAMLLRRDEYSGGGMPRRSPSPRSVGSPDVDLDPCAARGRG